MSYKEWMKQKKEVTNAHILSAIVVVTGLLILVMSFAIKLS